MTIDNDLRALLRDKASEAGPPPPATRSLLRRGRGRQVVTVTVSSLVVSAVVGGSLIGFATVKEQRRISASDVGTETTSVIENVAVTYPNSWSLAEIPGEVVVGEGKAGPTGAIEGHSIFQLANFAPTPGAPSLTYPAECAGSGPPAGAVVLYLQELRYPRIPGSQPPPWPVPIDGRTQNFSMCDPQTPPRYATWAAEGRIFEAVIYGSPSPDLDQMIQVFSDLRFGPRSAQRQQPPGASPYWVLDSGIDGEQRWNLLAYASTYPLAPTRVCVGLQVNGQFLQGQCDLNMSVNPNGSSYVGLEAKISRVRSGSQVVTYLYGGSSPLGAHVTTELESGTAGQPRLSQMPGALGVRFAAVVVVGGAKVRGLIRSTEDGPGLGSFPFFSSDQTPLMVEPSPKLRGAP